MEQNTGFGTSDEDSADCFAVGHDEIVLGDKLNDPYSLSNMREALENLYGTKAMSIQIDATDIYVRFLPKDWEEYQKLEKMGVRFFDHPLDYKILKDGDYYHDPSIPEDEITWQYSVVSPEFKFPSSIKYEILDECFVPTEVTVRSAEVDWEAVEREAFRISGNSDALTQNLKGSKESGIPKGNISIVDEDYQSGQPVGLAGVRVLCNSFVKIDWAYTDENGDYELSKTFNSDIHYRLVFSNVKGFGIGMNLILLPASYSTLGKNSPTGVNMVIDKNSERKLFCRSVVNNSVYEYFCMCENSSDKEEKVNTPPSNLRIWLMQGLSSSCTPMLQQGSFLDRTLIGAFLGDFTSIIKSFLPDVMLGLKDTYNYDDIFSLTVHELSHTSHYEKAGNTFWNSFIGFILSSFVSSGGLMYGRGNESDAGYCEVGEMWSYYLENKLYRERYGTEALSSGANFWFSPQILTYIDERGVGSGKICEALDGEVNTAEKLRDKLEELYPSDSEMIRQAFSRYGK